jgi:hypothetical protein
MIAQSGPVSSRMPVSLAIMLCSMAKNDSPRQPYNISFNSPASGP